MSGYTPVFRTVFEGSLCGQYPDTAAWLFMLALADKNGCVDKTPQYISAVTGMPVEELQTCIDRFMQPDPASRSSAEEGRRLVPIDVHRAWGWRIVNHEQYRERARKAAYDADRTASGADAERKRRQRGDPPTAAAVPRCPALSRAVPLSDSDADTDSDVRTLRSSSVGNLLPSSSERANSDELKTRSKSRKPELDAAVRNLADGKRLTG
jgi:hypothetical protein